MASLRQRHFRHWASSVFRLWKFQRQRGPCHTGCVEYQSQSLLQRPFYPHEAHRFCLGTHGPCGIPWPNWPRKPGLFDGLWVEKYFVIIWVFCLSLCVHSTFLAISLLLKTKEANWNKSFIGIWGPSVVYWILCLMAGAECTMQCMLKRVCPSGKEGSTFVYFKSLYVCKEHMLGIINLPSSLGRMWVSCHHCLNVLGHVPCFCCMVLLLIKPARFCG